jgi:hypothetical protein
MASKMDRKDELEKKRQRLEELRKARESRVKSGGFDVQLDFLATKSTEPEEKTIVSSLESTNAVADRTEQTEVTGSTQIYEITMNLDKT